MTKPLKEMETHLADAEGIPEDFAVSEDETDEISNLKRAYNHMAASVRELLVKTRREERAVQRGELELVLSQVSPHFLYNTLDTISGMDLPCAWDMRRLRPLSGCAAFFPAGAKMAAFYRRIFPGRYCGVYAVSHIFLQKLPG